MKPIRRAITGMIAIISVAGILSGCMKSSPVTSTTTDEQYFAVIANGDDASTRDIAVSDQEALNDNDMYNVSNQPLPPAIQSVSSDNRLHPEKWGRYIHGSKRVVTHIDLQGDSVALVFVEVTYTGSYVVVGTLNGAPDTVRKPYTETLHRVFRFIRIDKSKDSDEPKHKWKLDAVSVLSGGTQSSSVSFSKMQLVLVTGDTLSVTDPDAYLMEITKRWMHDLPLMDFNVRITVMATVVSHDPDTDVVTIHYCPKSLGLHRAPMAMISQTGDSVGGFVRLYRATFTVPGNDKKISNLVVSATSHASLYSTATADFSSVVWGLPYKTSE